MKAASTTFAGLLVALSATGGWAGDGRIEIGQPMVPYVITNSGSYVLTDNLVVTNNQASGITIHANNVAVDLNGFCLRSTSGTESGAGIHFPGGYHNLSVCNGSIVGWRGSNGVDGIGRNVRVEGVTVRENGSGISLHSGGIVSRCTAVSNSFAGILAGQGMILESVAWRNGVVGLGGVECVLNDCAVGNNGALTMESGSGLVASSPSTANRCASIFNVGHGARLDDAAVFDCTSHSNDLEGFHIMRTVVIDGCAVRANGESGIGLDTGMTLFDPEALMIRNCAVNLNGSNGVSILDACGSLIADNVIGANSAAGIEVRRDCAVVGNHCWANENGIVASWAGSQLWGSGNRIQGNTVVSNADAGIRVTGYTNCIAKNFASLNATNYDVAAGNSYNVINNTEVQWPWANYRY